MHTNVQERKDRVRTKQACGAPSPHSLSPNLPSLGHRLSQILLPEDIFKPYDKKYREWMFEQCTM